jgi:hypothetical protein
MKCFSCYLLTASALIAVLTATTLFKAARQKQASLAVGSLNSMPALLCTPETRGANMLINNQGLQTTSNSSLNTTSTYYVAPTGQDQNAGTLNAPFRTIQHAASVARAGDSVIIRGGTYRETIVPQNSGTAVTPITFQAAPGETVTLCGTTSVPTNSWVRVGTTNTWYTTWPGNYTSSNNQSDQVFVDGKMINLARWPQEANNNLSLPRQATIDSIVSSTNTGKKAPGPQYPIQRITFTDAEWDQPNGRWNGAKVWLNTGGRDTRGLTDEVQDGNGQTGIVISTDLTRKQLTVEVDATAALSTALPQHFQLGNGSYYYLFDPPSVNGLLYKGEFWRDRISNRLYLQTPDGSSPSNHVVEVKQRDYAFNLSNKSYITVKGLNIFAASITTDIAAGNGQGNGGNREGSIALANHITLDGLKIKYVSHFTDQTGNIQTQWSQSSGIILSGSDNLIQNSEIAWSAGSGLVMIGKGNKALHNVIHDTNYAATDGGAVSLGRTTKTVSLDEEVGYNTIYNTGIDGIDFSALKNSSGSQSVIQSRIHHNTIYNTVLQSADSGAIKAYASDGGWTRIDHNIIYNTGGANLAHKYTFFGIYLDYPQSKGEYIIDHNVVYNTPINININGGKNVAIYNNTLIARPEIGRAPISANGTLQNVKIHNLLTNRRLPFDAGSVTLSNNIFDATESIAWFVDATNSDLARRNYRLTAGAVRAINQGANVTPFNDATLPDIGAYEF